MSPIRVVALLALFCGLSASGQTFRVATYNVQNYLDAPSGTRPAKSDASKSKVRESIRALAPDVLALQEVGQPSAFAELRESLAREGQAFAHHELVFGWDTNIHVAVLSKFPITARRPHTNDSFVLFGKQFRVKRGFAEVDIQVNSRLTLTLITGHLKSKLSAFEADEQELRDQEAELLRAHVDRILDARPTANLVVLGDFNDTQESKPIRTIIGRKHSLVDTRPCEMNGDDQPSNNPHYRPARITWTHCYGKEDSFRRIDYILLSRNLARRWMPEQSQVLRLPNWGVGSDHRPIVATFSMP